jgi:hypothetical protein
MLSITLHLGLDVHKHSITIAEGRSKGEIRFFGSHQQRFTRRRESFEPYSQSASSRAAGCCLRSWPVQLRHCPSPQTAQSPLPGSRPIAHSRSPFEQFVSRFYPFFGARMGEILVARWANAAILRVPFARGQGGRHFIIAKCRQLINWSVGAAVS